MTRNVIFWSIFALTVQLPHLAPAQVLLGAGAAAGGALAGGTVAGGAAAATVGGVIAGGLGGLAAASVTLPIIGSALVVTAVATSEPASGTN